MIQQKKIAIFNVFTHSLGLSGIGFNLTDDGNFDLDGKRLTDVVVPVDYSDATTKAYVDTKNSQQDSAINSKAEKTDVILRDGSQSMNANLNLNNKKITNLANATSDGDAVNFSQLKSHTDSHLNNYHLQKSFTFFKNFGDQAQLKQRNIGIPNHNHHDLLIIKKEGSDPGFGGEAWVSLKMTNYLAAGVYTVVFETFSDNFGSPSNITTLNNETLITQVYGNANYKIITFTHDYQTTHSKAVIQFTSNGQAGEITFQIRYYGSSYNNPILYFLFYSRVLAGRVGTAFNHALFDVDDVQLKNQILYFEDVNLNENKIKGLAAPSEDKDRANKRYVDDEIKAIPAVDTSDLLKLDGTRAMSGDLNMNRHRITYLPPPVSDMDLINLRTLKDVTIDHNKNDYEFQSGFTFFKNFGDHTQLTQSNINIPNHNHRNLLIVEKEDYSVGHNARAWSTLRMTTNIPTNNFYTLILEIFPAIISSPTNINFLEGRFVYLDVYLDIYILYILYILYLHILMYILIS